LLVGIPFGRAVVMRIRRMQAKYKGRVASTGLRFGVADWSMKHVYMD
jgi:hypothetical protein